MSNTLRVVDGMQRLSTIRDFYAEQFPLTELEYLTDAKDKRITGLSPQWRRRIDNTQIFAHVIDPTTPTRVTYDIFKRINTLTKLRDDFESVSRRRQR